MAHSVDMHGNICVNLNDFIHVSESIKYRDKINALIEKYTLPREISNFSVSIRFRDGTRYYLSNLYLWAIPYLTEGLHRGDRDHDEGTYRGKDFFIQRDLGYDSMQIPIIHLLETRYQLHTTFAMVRTCLDCDLIIEAYNHSYVTDPQRLYHQVKQSFEQFIIDFLDEMITELQLALPKHKHLAILSDPVYRKKIIKETAISPAAILSPRETQCLIAHKNGLTNKAISELLNLSEETIISHTKSIRRKLNSKNITQAVAIAIGMRLIV